MTTTEQTYIEATEEWRAKVEAELRADNGWLTLAGLFWLSEGANAFGSDPDGAVPLPDSSLPAFLGNFVLQGREVTLEPAPGAALQVNGAPASAQRLRPSAGGQPDLVTAGSLTMLVHHSGERIGIRLRDSSSSARQQFAGRRWFPIDERYVVTATFEPYDPPRILAVTNIVGDSEPMASPGILRFTLDGQACQLDIMSRRGRGFWLHLHDQSAGAGSYPGGRFLYTAPLEHGQVQLDFNRAVSPPCAFTPFATCPMILPQNRLPLRIAAGERWEPKP